MVGIAWLLLFSFAAEYHGTVKFGGLPVPGAAVTVTQGDKKQVAVSSDDGTYSFPDLVDGPWAVQVEMLCFAPLKGDSTTSDWELKLLPFDEIKASAPPPPRAPTTSLTTTVAAPAAPPPDPNPKARGYQRAEVNASGEGGKMAADPPVPPSDSNQTASDAFAINGSVNNGAASEFGQSAAFGNARKGAGGLLHGNLGLILDNSYLDANSFSLTGQNTPKPAYNHLQGVGNVGGLLRIPHLITGNTMNFFVGFQVMRNRNANTQSALVPTAAERAGDLSQLGFAGGAIPASRISPQAQALLNLYPLPNFDASARYNYQIPITGTNNQEAITARVNKSINAKNQVYGTFAWQGTATKDPNLFGFVDSGSTGGFNTALNFSHRFTTRVFTHVQYQFSRYTTRTTPYFANRENVSGAAGIAGNNQDALNWGPPQLSFSSGIASLSDGRASAVANQTGALSFDTFWIRKSHNISMGSDYKRLQFNSLSQQNPRGTFTFTGAATGNDFADFLTGIPDTSAIAFGNADKYFRSALYDAYVTDDWRAGRGFTLNLGVRWEYNAPITELYGRLVNLDVAPGFGPAAPVVASHPAGTLTGQTYPDSLVHPDKTAFQPRLAASWRPFPDSSMVVRAGYGLYYNTSVYQSIASQMAQQSPLSKSLSVQNSAGNPLTLANGFNASPAGTPNTFAIDPNFRVGFAHTWQLSVQRDLPGSLVGTVTYIGTKGTRQVQEFLPNTYPSGVANPCPACAAGYIYMASNGNSTREAGQIQLRRRLHNGFTASVQYTFAKAIDDAALGGRGQGTAVIAQNWLNLSGERGLSNFDQRHLLSATVQYTTGMGLRGGTLLGGWRGAALKDWTFLSLITAGSGLPETPIYLSAVQGTGVTGSIRPNYTGASLYAAPPGFFLNPAAVAAPAPGEWGNAGRNSITGPDQFSVNASMSRTFRLNDRFNADLRFDSINALNHVTFPSWNTTVTNLQFGLPNNANPMRSLQATLRVRF